MEKGRGTVLGWEIDRRGQGASVSEVAWWQMRAITTKATEDLGLAPDGFLDHKKFAMFKVFLMMD